MNFGVRVWVTKEARADADDQLLIERAQRRAFSQGYTPTGEQPKITWILLDGHNTAVVMGNARPGDYEVRITVPIEDMP